MADALRNHLKIRSFQWVAAIFLIILGTMTLVSPNQFDFLETILNESYLLIWGMLFLLFGIVLMLSFIIRLPGSWLFIVQLLAGASLIVLVAILIEVDSWLNTINYAFLGLSLWISGYIDYKRTEIDANSQIDLFGLLVGLCSVTAGILLLFAPPGFKISAFTFNHAQSTGFGVAMLAGGVLCLSLRFLPLQTAGRLVAVRAFSSWMISVIFFALLITSARQSLIWFAVTFYGVVGVVLLFYPWIDSQLSESGKIPTWAKLSLLFSVITTLPLILAVALVIFRLDPSLSEINDSIRNSAFTILLGSVILTTVLGALVANWLAGPVDALVTAAMELTAANPNIELPHSRIEEVERLLSAFREMRAQLVKQAEEKQKADQALQKARDELEQHLIAENQKNRELLQAIFDSDPAGLAVIVGEELVYQMNNPAYQTFIPDPSMQLNGRRYEDVWPQTEGFQFRPLILRAMKQRETLFTERHKRRYPDGSIRYFSIHLCPLNWSGQPAVLSVLWETTSLEYAQQTAEQAAEKAMRHAEELVEARQKLALYAKRLEISNRELEQFAFVASHDLQEPARKVRAFGERLQATAAEKLAPAEKDYLERLMVAAGRMQDMIRDLLELSRVTTRGKPFVTTDLSKIAAEVISDMEIAIERTGGQMIVEPLPTIQADPLQMRQLLQNLISNALKYHKTDQPPVVKIYNQKTGSTEDNHGQSREVNICVEDNGIGFDEQYSERIFQPFQRLHSRSEYEGTGIGLAICKKIVERHHGRIQVTSRPGSGSTFVIILPMNTG